MVLMMYLDDLARYALVSDWSQFPLVIIDEIHGFKMNTFNPDGTLRDEAGEVRRMFEINFFGLARMTRAVLPGMRKRRSGHIINIASICGLAAIPSLGDYSATKFAVEGLSEVLALEAGPHSPWMSRLLSRCGHEVIVGNPSKIPSISKSRSKNDWRHDPMRCRKQDLERRF